MFRKLIHAWTCPRSHEGARPPLPGAQLRAAHAPPPRASKESSCKLCSKDLVFRMTPLLQRAWKGLRRPISLVWVSSLLSTQNHQTDACQDDHDSVYASKTHDVSTQMPTALTAAVWAAPRNKYRRPTKAVAILIARRLCLLTQHLVIYGLLHHGQCQDRGAVLATSAPARPCARPRSAWEGKCSTRLIRTKRHAGCKKEECRASTRSSQESMTAKCQACGDVLHS